jgi:Na+/H+ antiporter NhaD/arsenite permease-like protein
MIITAPMLVSAAILVATYILIFRETIHRTLAAIIGSVVMIGVGMAMEFYSQEEAIAAIDANTILLLAGMMILVALMRPTGVFDYTAVRLAQLSGGDPRKLLLYLSLVVSVISMILDNVTTLVVFAPLTVLICRLMKLNPMPFLLTEAMLSNISGTATLVGDPPNIMIGSAGAIDFVSFFTHMGPPIMVVWIGAVTLLLFLFRKELAVPIHPYLELDHSRAIKDPLRVKLTLLSAGLIVALFFIHHHLHLYPAYAVFIGLAVAFLLLQPKPDDLFGSVNWSVLIFFCGLFMIVGGVEASGLLALLGTKLGALATDPEMLLIACLILMWVAALLSAIVDNIPFTVTMIPIILSLEPQGVNIAPLWWALSFGVGLGGNATHIGATANLIAVTESERCGIKDAYISPAVWARRGIPTTLASLAMATLIFTIFFNHFL